MSKENSLINFTQHLVDILATWGKHKLHPHHMLIFSPCYGEQVNIFSLLDPENSSYGSLKYGGIC